MKNKINIWTLFFSAIIILGFITPFIDYFVVIQIFFLLIPFGIILIISFFIFLLKLSKHKLKIFDLKSTKLSCIIPLFLFSQFISTYVIDEIQLYRSNKIIEKIENKEIQLYDKPQNNFGIEYHLLRDKTYLIEYERGFMVKEKYYSENKIWKSYGWND